MTLWARSLRPKLACRPVAPPRCTWKPSTWRSPSITSWPLRPMSATWVRAHALGQPLTLTVIGTSRSGKRRSSSATRSRARFLVSTMASLQNSMPVQAIVLRRQPDGPGRRARSRRAARRRSSTDLRVDADQHDLLVRREAGAGDAVLLDQVGELDQHACRRPGRRSARCRRTPGRRAAGARRCGRGGPTGEAGESQETSGRRRYSFSSTSRNFSTPQSATRNFSRARERSRR